MRSKKKHNFVLLDKILTKYLHQSICINKLLGTKVLMAFSFSKIKRKPFNKN